MTDTQLITALQKGDQEAFREVFDKYYRMLLYFSINMIKEREIAEEIVSSTFSKCFFRRVPFNDPSHIKAFLFITTKNSCLDYLIKKQTEKKKQNDYEALISDLHYPQEEIERRIIEASLMDKIYREVKALPERCREVIILTYFEGKKANEISQLLNITISTVTNQRSRGLDKLRLKLRGPSDDL